MRALFLTVALLAPSLVASPARAQGPTGEASSRADRVFREGRAAANLGDYATARDRFLESERLEPAPGTLLNVADCEVHLGLLVAAREHFELAASGFPRGDSRRTWATGQATQIEKRLARLTLRLDPDAPAGTVVTRNGSPVEAGALGQEALTDPGNVEIVVTAPGRVPKKTALTLAEGQSLQQTLAVGPPELAQSPPTGASPSPSSPVSGSDTTPEPSAPMSPSDRPLRPVGFVVGGVGVAGLVVGSITGIIALDRASTMKSHCNTSTWSCDSQGVDAASSGGTFATVSTVSFVAGAVLAGVGAFLVLAGPESRATALVVPYVDPHGAGAAFARSF